METEAMQNRQSLVMSVWLSCVVLSSLIHQTQQNAGHLPTVKDVKAYTEETDTSQSGAWVLIVAWRDEFDENTESGKLTYDIEIFRTEQMMSVYNETVQVKADPTTRHQWKWTSTVPLQCTSHSVRLRRRDHQTGHWSELYTYKGQDLIESKTTVYPHDQYFLVGSSITFCCILKAERVFSFHSSEFKIRISNRTFITEPVYLDTASGIQTLDCDESGSTVFIGYPPDDHNLTCVTRDLSSVQCSWNRGRKTNIEGENGRTKYTLNGRPCLLDRCVLPNNTVTNWTLIAKNPLGVKILNDAANPLHRVWLKAPTNIMSNAYERSATLQWSWAMDIYDSYPMICQVELNGHIFNKTFLGTGLKSLVLQDLQSATGYNAKVRCGSSEQFYMWGEWSNTALFKTKEDIPEALDVWMQYLENSIYVLWKPLTNRQSRVVLTGFDVTITDSQNKTSSFHKESNATCHRISTTTKPGKPQIISVSAKNSAGLSPPASIILPNNPGTKVKEFNGRNINGHNGSFDLVWTESSSSSGYVVDWFPTYSQEQCVVQWKKFPAGHFKTKIEKVLQPGVKYTVSVYSITAGASQLLQRREVYALEKKPSGPVQAVKCELIGKDLKLSWDEVPLPKQGGFILGYKIKIFDSDSQTTMKTIETTNKTLHLKLDPGSYTINISAFTSAGDGDNATFHRIIKKDFIDIIVGTCLGSSIAALLSIIVTFLCYRQRKWLKKRLYPEITKPKLSGQWTKKEIYCFDMIEGYTKCMIQKVHSVEHPTLDTAVALALIRSSSVMCPANDLYQCFSKLPLSSCTPATSLNTMDPTSSFACAQNFTTVIGNPIYHLTMQEAVHETLLSGPALEMDDSYLPAPNVGHNTFNEKDSLHYKPQSPCL